MKRLKVLFGHVGGRFQLAVIERFVRLTGPFGGDLIG